MAKQRRASKVAVLTAEDVRVRLADGRTAGALKQAKEFAKQSPNDPAVLELLAECYAARYLSLLDADQHTEADELLRVARARLPNAGTRWDDLAARARSQRGDLDAALKAWLESPDSAAAERLARELVDPSALAAALPKDHALRCEADAIVTTFDRVVREPQRPAALEPLRCIGRRSPLRSWRDLVLALAAVHASDAARARELLDRIPAQHGAAELAAVVAGALDGAPAESDQAEQALLARWLGARDAALTHLDALEECDESCDHEGYIAAWRQLVEALASLNSELVPGAIAHVMGAHDEEVDAHVLRAARGKARPGAIARAIAQSSSNAMETSLAWYEWSLAQPIDALSDLELAVLLDTIARSIQEARAEASLLLRLNGLPPIVDLGDTGALQSAIERAWFVADPEPPTDVMFALDWWGAMSKLFKFLRQRVGKPRIADDAELGLRAHACTLDPSASRYAALAGCAREVDSDSRDSIVAEWRAAFPHDVRPVLAKIEEAERLGRHKLARSLVDEAKSIDSLDAAVRAAELRVVLLGLHKHMRRGQFHLCEEELATLETLPAAATPACRNYVAAARLEIATRLADAAVIESTRAQLERRVGDADRIEEALRVVRAVVERGRRAEPVGATVAERIRSLARMLRLTQQVVGAPADLFCERPAELAANAVDIGELPTDREELFALGEFALRREVFELAYAVSGAALGGAASDLARFLLIRMIAVSSGSPRSERVADLAFLCVHFAHRYDDRSTQRKLIETLGATIDLASHELRGPLAEGRAAALLDRERRLESISATKPKRRASKPRQRKVRDSGQGLLPFAEGSAESQ